MKKLCVNLIAVLLLCYFIVASTVSQAAQRSASSQTQSSFFKKHHLVPYDSSTSKSFFCQNQYTDDFFLLSQFFVTQKTLTFCSIASAVMVLNALDIPKPFSQTYHPFHIFTQRNVLTPEVRKVIDIKSLHKSGLTLNEFSKLVRVFPVKIQIFHAKELTFHRFQKKIIKALQKHNTFVVVNFDRTPLYGAGGGHFSPLGAYNKKTHRFLLLDVARFKYPPVWIKAQDLWHAVNTIDSASHQTRGLAIISRR